MLLTTSHELNYLKCDNAPMIECVFILLLEKKIFLKKLFQLVKKKFLYAIKI